MLYKVVLTSEPVDEILKCDIQMKAIEGYFSVVLVSMLGMEFASVTVNIHVCVNANPIILKSRFVQNCSAN